MPKQVPYLNVFLSSPGDVEEERAIAREIMKSLPDRPTFKGRVAINIIAWDALDSSIAMEARLNPQVAINQGLPTPAESDIVIVIFWSRMGTPFTDEDGKEYLSGTHWELLNALSSKSTKTYIYRRMQSPSIFLFDLKRNEKIKQYDRVQNFFKSGVFYDEAGQIQRSVHQYENPVEFTPLFERHFEEIVLKVLEEREQESLTSRKLEAAMPEQTKLNTATEVWVKISLPLSKGLRGELPAAVKSGNIIEKSDTRTTGFKMDFPQDDITGELSLGTVCLEVTSKHFTVSTDEMQGDCEDGQYMIEVEPLSDTPTMIFDLEPVKERHVEGQASIRITAYQNGKVIARRAISTELVTEIKKKPDWLLVALQLGISADDTEFLKTLEKFARFAEEGELPGTMRADFREKLYQRNINPESLPESLQRYAETEQEQLIRELYRRSDTMEGISVSRRVDIGNRLAEIGDIRRGVGVDKNGIPDIVWCDVPAGDFLYGRHKEKRTIDYDYAISKYPVTNAQFQAFVDAEDGYNNPQWWTKAGLAWKGKRTVPYQPHFDLPNHPRTEVTWYEAYAFTQWLSVKSGHKISLPTEEQWEKAARGTDGRIFPWGDKWDETRCNTYESGIRRTSTVGIFPSGDSPYGISDMAGNVWEWCLTDYDSGSNDAEGTSVRVLRGGSFGHDQYLSACAYRPSTQSS